MGLTLGLPMMELLTFMLFGQGGLNLVGFPGLLRIYGAPIQKYFLYSWVIFEIIQFIRLDEHMDRAIKIRFLIK